ncbi:hypothetical protein [Cryobacterium glucosi]|nr:hypothetical protein [Cryobacterium glucosi]
MRNWITNALEIAGAALIVTGAAFVSPPTALIVFGVGLYLIGVRYQHDEP